VRRNVAGIDLGSERHGVCAPVEGDEGREVEDFGATTAELFRMGKWLQARGLESVAMESTGVYWIVPTRYRKRRASKSCWWIRASWRGAGAG
jgi:hypothetical protein